MPLYHANARLEPGAEIEPHRDAELARVMQLHEHGVIEQLFTKADATGAHLIMRADDRATLDAAIASLPFVHLGLMTFEVEEISKVL
jgi:muconolactone delta-isomerase